MNKIEKSLWKKHKILVKKKKRKCSKKIFSLKINKVILTSLGRNIDD